MFRGALLFLAFTLSATSWATHSWGPYYGCYKTLTVNGTRVTEGDQELNQTFIKEVDSTMVMDMNNQPIPAIEMMIFVGYDESRNTYNYDLQAAFTDRGTFSGNTYRFAGDLRLSFEPYTPFNLDQTLTMNLYKQNILEVKAVRKIVSSEFSGIQNNTYLLERTICDETHTELDKSQTKIFFP